MPVPVPQDPRGAAPGMEGQASAEDRQSQRPTPREGGDHRGWDTGFVQVAAQLADVRMDPRIALFAQYGGDQQRRGAGADVGREPTFTKGH